MLKSIAAAVEDCERPPRRLVAAGIIRRRDGRTTTITATPAGITGRITPAVQR
ncbi:hypothetical protein ABZ883_26340 [Streptomyces sp. NPDC046977]|uniref:hypothetical protein n=1 Tax=Streptomyces sp. NPDC046977 TaxID=3154703 RepID=UPI00340FBDBE